VARLGVLYENRSAQRFRAAIRPSLVGRLKYIEPNIAAQAAIALGEWMQDMVATTLRATIVNDPKGELARSLYSGIRIYGRASLSNLRAQVQVYPWIMAQEYGAHIEPTGGRKYLAIPIFFGLRADGSPKFLNPASWKRFGSFVYTSKADGRKFLAYKAKTDNQLKILYVLVDDVELKPKLGLVRTAGSMLGSLLSVWGEIYLREAVQAGVFELWDRVYK
jgi:hypothetical protein